MTGPSHRRQAVRSGAMAVNRMNREDFYAKVSPLDVEQLIDLACEMRGVEYFHSEDPVEAARFVVSHAVSALWQTMLDQHGFAAFAGRAAPQLIRWESEYGWTRGDGKVAENEALLAE